MICLSLVLALRIVSLAPALTEDLFAIGAGPAVVGVDANSNRPAGAARLPRVGGMREVSAEAVLALHPDVVVGIPYEDRILADLTRAGVRTERLDVSDLRGDFAAIERLGVLSGHAREARALHRVIERRLAGLSAQAARSRTASAFVAVGISDLRTAGRGTYIDDLLRMANLRNVAGDLPLLWPQYSQERLVAVQPEILVLPNPHPALLGAPWERIDAVRAGRIVEIDEDDLLRPGPRVADVLEMLVAGAARWR